MTRALIYARQSIEKDGGDASLSIESQLAALRDRCAREGWTVVGEVREAGLKGWQDEDDRPGMARVLAMASRGELDVLLVWDLSRLARRVEYQERWIRLLDGAGVAVESQTEPDARRNALLRQIKGAINEERTREIAAHTRRALRERAQRGLPQGRPPWGMRRARRAGPFEPDPDASEAVETVRLIFERRAAGASIEQIRRELAARGVPSSGGFLEWRWQTVAQILRNPAYRGAVQFGAILVEDAHPAVVDPATWHAAQTPKARDRRRGNKGGTSWLEGLVRHCCGEPMYLTAASPPNRPYVVLRCRRFCDNAKAVGIPNCGYSPRAIAVANAERMAWAAVGDGLAGLLDPRLVLAEARRRHRANRGGDEQRRADLLARRARAESRRVLAEDLYMSGRRDRAWFDAEDDRAAAELAGIDAELAAIPAAPDPVAIAALHRDLADVRDALALVPDARKGDVLRRLGVAVVEPTGRRRGRGDPGAVRIDWRPEVAAMLGDAR